MKNQTPPNLPRVPNDFIYYGEGPLKVIADGKHVKHMKDVAATLEGCDQWATMHWGNSEFNYYALRKGSEIARLNGLEDNTTKSEPTMKTLPAGIPNIPSATLFFGKGPLKVLAIDRQCNDTFALAGVSWSSGWAGDGTFYYALRKNSEIAKLNGLTETETQIHMKNQMKLKLQVLNSDEIQVPSGMVAFCIVEQEGFADSKIYESDEHTFRSVYLPDFNENGTKITFYLRGAEKSRDNRIMVIPRVKYDKLVAAIDSLLKKENAPKILYTATFFYKNEKNGSQKRRMIEVITENDTHLAGNDKDDGGKYKNFLKANVIGAIDKVKS